MNFFKFQCSVSDCLKSFESEQDLKQHKKRQHLDSVDSISDERKHICEICGSKFLRPSHLKTHMKLHENPDKQFQCNYCPERFIKQSLFIQHVNHVHKNEEKIFKYYYRFLYFI